MLYCEELIGHEWWMLPYHENNATFINNLIILHGPIFQSSAQYEILCDHENYLLIYFNKFEMLNKIFRKYTIY